LTVASDNSPLNPLINCRACRFKSSRHPAGSGGGPAIGTGTCDSRANATWFSYSAIMAAFAFHLSYRGRSFDFAIMMAPVAPAIVSWLAVAASYVDWTEAISSSR